MIGVLDIYGFECFKVNSFEQMCINLTNEKLQQHFNQHVFKMEQEEYIREGINWSNIDFVDNQDVLDLIEKKPGGIIALLDEACMFPKSTHETFAQKMYQTYKNHKRFSKPKLARTEFTINHYAGDVTYLADLFLEKNKDFVVPEHQALLNASPCPFVASLFPPLPEESSKSSKFSSIGTRFKQQLQALMETLSTTEPHYIRCVKPNGVLKPGIFENFNVLQQLRCGGVLETIRISCAGYPTKRTFDEFLDRFGMLAPEVLEGYDERTACDKICEKMGLKGYQIGKTKVFLRAGQMAELDARRIEILGQAARLIQRQVRTHLAQREFVAMRKAAVHFQALWRGKLARKLYEHMKREAAAIQIQKHLRGHQARRTYVKLRLSAIIVQTGFRAMAARNEYRFRRQSKAAIIIQAKWRAHRAHESYKKKKQAALDLQCAWRSRVARKELKKLKMAARETGALKEAKDKLEKRVEELTWRLELEKHMRTDLEEAKAQEIAKLQLAIEKLQAQAQEANSMLAKEREVAKIAVEQANAVVKEVPVVDTAKVEKLTHENEELKALGESLQKVADQAERKYSEALRESEERLKISEDQKSKIDQLQDSLQRLKENLSNLESENQVLRQQALVMSTSRDFSLEIKTLEEKVADLESQNQALREQKTVVVPTPEGPPRPIKVSVLEKNMENGPFVNMESIDTEVDTENMQYAAPVVKRHVERELKPQRSLNNRQQENHDALIKCISQDVGFSRGRPVAACAIYKSLLQWRSFEADKTNVFNRIIHMIGSAIESQESHDILYYWLSNTSTLLFLLQSTLKASAAAGVASQRGRLSSVSLFGKMAQGFRSSQSGMGISGGMISKLDVLRQVEAKYPALLFKQQLTAYVEKIYGVIRDNLKKDISPLLSLCIQAPRTARTRPIRGSSRSSQASVTAKQALSSHWQSILKSLNSVLEKLKANYVPSVLVRNIFTQTFSFINVQLFNSLLLRRECCSFSNGEYVKAGLAELERWCHEATAEYAGSAWDELTHIRQAVGFLVIQKKSQKSVEEIINDLCPVLSIQQIYRISTMFWDDKYGTHSVSPDVIAQLRTMMTEDSIMMSSSFLLDDDSSIPFSVDDISKSVQDMNLSDVDPPPLLRQNSDFHFLLPRAE